MPAKKIIIPPKLKRGDGVRVIAPSKSLRQPWMTKALRRRAAERFADLGLRLTFGAHVEGVDEFHSSSLASRIADLHAAFRDPSVQLIIAANGGNNANQLLRHLDYGLIQKNPKILCGCSDITALSNAIFAKTGLVTYSGPNFFEFANERGFDYTRDYFEKCLFSAAPLECTPPPRWSDDDWTQNQSQRTFLKNDGYWILMKGRCEGRIVGGNQCTLNLLHGTEFMPPLNNSILFLEDDKDVNAEIFDRDLQSILHQPNFSSVQGIVIGRFQKKSGITKKLLKKIVSSKKELRSIPIIANADFGHTDPQITFPVGGRAILYARGTGAALIITKH